jgi:hypothetical protein
LIKPVKQSLQGDSILTSLENNKKGKRFLFLRFFGLHPYKLQKTLGRLWNSALPVRES